MSNKVYISMYHYTRDLRHSRYPKIKGLDISLFKQQLEYFKVHFNVIRMEQLIDAVKRHSLLPENALLLTFDDGYIDNFTFAMPLLEEFGFQGSFFIPGKTFATHQLLDVNKVHFILACADISKLVTDLFERLNFYRGSEFEYPSNAELYRAYAAANRFDSKDTIFVKRVLQTVLPEKLRNMISSDLFKSYVGISEEKIAYELYMSQNQIETMRRHGMFIGLHGYDHYWLGNLTDEDMKADVDKALETLDMFVDQDEWVMNYPYGNYNQRVLDYVKSKGAVLGLTTEVRIAEIEKDCALALPRFDCNDFPPISERYREI